MRFKASLDNTSIAVSLVVALFFALIIGLQISFSNSATETKALLLSGLLVCIYAGAFLFRPLAYEVTGQSLVVYRPVKNLQIPLHTISSVERVAPDQLRQSIRTFGVGGLFGYYGKFYHRAFGPMTWYATRRDKGVMLTLRDNQKILLTPDEPERFIRLFSR